MIASARFDDRAAGAPTHKRRRPDPCDHSSSSDSKPLCVPKTQTPELKGPAARFMAAEDTERGAIRRWLGLGAGSELLIREGWRGNGA